jgi:hypothetical protein
MRAPHLQLLFRKPPLRLLALDVLQLVPETKPDKAYERDAWPTGKQSAHQMLEEDVLPYCCKVIRDGAVWCRSSFKLASEKKQHGAKW